MTRTGSLYAVCLLVLFALSCSGSSSGPITPGSTPDSATGTGKSIQGAGSNSHLWGIWEIYIDPVSETAEAVPVRCASYACNINEFIDGPPSNLILRNMVVTNPVGATDISLDVGLQHPFPGADTYTGFDVLGVFMGLGSKVYPGTVALPVPGQNDMHLRNPDGYTRWFNRPEFKNAGELLNLFGYDPGRAGTPAFYPTARLCPFKYFAGGLDVNDDVFEFLMDHSADRGCFRPGEANYRRYDLRFPNSLGIKFQYAVIAHWEEHDNYPGQPNGLGDFPISANSFEAVALSVVDNSTAFYSSGIFGGEVVLDITPWDWSAECNPSGVMEEYEVKCFSDAWTGEYAVDMTPTAAHENYNTYHAEIPVEDLDNSQPLPVWIEVNYPGLDYSNPFGIQNEAQGALAAYFKFDVTVSNELPVWIQVLTPNGGEVWYPGTDEEITWVFKDVTGTVYIEYSRDNFNSDINTIAIDEPCDGSYMWTIPDDPTPDARVRITSTDDPAVSDRSNADFTIYGPWIVVTDPNGGEVWEPGTGENITWTSQNMAGTVFIEYSKDNFVGDINTIAVGETDDGSYTWNPIPFDPSTTVRVRVSSTVDPGVYDTSDADFTITTVPNWILVGVPNGGEKWVVGSNRQITWTSEYVPGTVFIEYSRDNFVGDINPIALGQTNDGSYMWNSIPNDPSSTVRVRVSSTDAPSVNDVSDSDFEIATLAGWAQTWGGSGDDEGLGVATDAVGNYYVAGVFRGTADLDPEGGVDNHTAVGSKDVFLSKFNSVGNYQWGLTWGGIGDDYGYGIAVDGSNNIYVTGYFWATVDFDPGAGSDSQTSSGGADVFLSKFNSSGSFQWARTWGGLDSDQGLGVALDGSGNPYVTGYFMNTVDFDPGPGTESRTSRTSPQGFSTSDVFVSRFSSVGNFNWVQAWGGDGVEYGEDVSIDGSGNVCVGGWFQSTVDFDPTGGTDNRTSAGAGDAFLSRLSSTGVYQWARTWGGTGTDSLLAVVADGSGNIAVTGLFQGTVDFDPGGGVVNRTSSGMSDAYLLRLGSLGLYQWVNTWGGTGQDTGNGISIDPSGNIFITGAFDDIVDFDPGAGTESRTSNGGADAFVSRFNSTGVFQWVRTWGASAGESGRGVALDGSGNLFLTGSFKQTVDFAPTGPPCNANSDNHATVGNADVFLLKYFPNGCW